MSRSMGNDGLNDAARKLTERGLKQRQWVDDHSILAHSSRDACNRGLISEDELVIAKIQLRGLAMRIQRENTVSGAHHDERRDVIERVKGWDAELLSILTKVYGDETLAKSAIEAEKISMREAIKKGTL